MTDIHVHVRMRKCCQQALKKLDDIRAAAGRAGGAARQGRTSANDGSTLVAALASLPIPRATVAVNQLHATHSDLTRLDVSGKSAWENTISSHRHMHEQAQESTEAAFWNALAVPVEVIDLSGSPDLNKQIFDRTNGEKRFFVGGDGDKPGQNIIDQLKARSGNRLNLDDGRLLFKVVSPTDDTSIFFGAGKIKEPGGSTTRGVLLEVKF
jgi:hypothetical protein